MIIGLLEINPTNRNFVSSKDIGETRTIYVWSDSEENRLGNGT